MFTNKGKDNNKGQDSGALKRKMSTSNARNRSNRRTHKHKRHLPRSLILAGIIVIGLALVGASGGTAYAINQENHDAFCASCHTQPETTYYQQSMGTTPATLAAFHAQKSVRCIDCHSGGGPFGRLVGISQGAQDLLAYKTGNYHSPAITTNPISDSSCLKCHANVTQTQDFNNHFHVFLTRWQSVDPNAAHCVTCHTGHPTNQANLLYMNQTNVEQTCQRCHQAIRE